MIALITPLHRPRELERSRAFHERLSNATDLECVSLIVGNGPALGLTELSSDPHQTHAMNVGLERASELGCSHWLKLDADDYYGDGYVAEQVAALESTGATLVGKSDNWMTLSNGCLYKQGIDGHDRQTCRLYGYSLGARIDSGLRFQSLAQSGEDTELLERVHSNGGLCWATSPYNVCYHRHNDGRGHTSDWDDLTLIGTATAAGCQFYDTGEGFSADIVNGEREPLRLDPVAQPPVEQWGRPWSLRRTA